MFKKLKAFFKTKTQSYEKYLAECKKTGEKPKSEEEFKTIKKSCWLFKRS